jgi:hypothetical protein
MQMKITFVAIMFIAVSIMLVLPEANALTPRTDFSDNHFTYLTFTTIHICGDRICTPDEWDQWIGQLMSSQIQNDGSIPSTSNLGMYGQPSATSSPGSMTDTSNAKITKVTTFDIGNNEFSSFVSISYDGYLQINHIVVSQTKPGITIHRAWIEPQWSSVIQPGNVTFDSNQSSLHHNSVINLVLVTDGKPTFSLDTLSSSQFP